MLSGRDVVNVKLTLFRNWNDFFFSNISHSKRAVVCRFLMSVFLKGKGQVRNRDGLTNNNDSRKKHKRISKSINILREERMETDEV